MKCCYGCFDEGEAGFSFQEVILVVVTINLNTDQK